jgi:hypothetical protein
MRAPGADAESGGAQLSCKSFQVIDLKLDFDFLGGLRTFCHAAQSIAGKKWVGSNG